MIDKFQIKIRNFNYLLFLVLTISCNKTKVELPYAYDENELNLEMNASERFLDKEISKGFLPNQVIWSSDNVDLNGDGNNDNIKVVVFDEFFFNSKKEDETDFFKAKIFINNLSQDYVFNWTRNSYWYKEGTKFEIIDFDKTDKYKEFIISQKEQYDEDPSTIKTIFRYFGNNLLTKSTIESQGYNGGNLKLIDNNKFTIQHCRNPKIIGTYALSNFFIKKTDMIEEAFNPNTFVACPFVYLKSGEKFIYKGEIIRNLIGKESESMQKLEIGTLDKGIVTIRIKEEKNEISYINSIYFEINNKLYLPKTIKSKASLLQKNDDKYLVLKKGEFIDLVYDLDLKSNIKIISKGYYIPIKN
jgi:hypothetical protein